MQGQRNVIIMPPAATILKGYQCVLVTPSPVPTPHTGGMIILGEPTVLIGNMPAARMGDTLLCNGPPPHPDTIAKGSVSVLIGGKPAARMGDITASGGLILLGVPTVIIGG